MRMSGLVGRSNSVAVKVISPGERPADAANASGLLTTTLQLGQAVGVAAFGSLFLTLAAHRGPHPSAHAITITMVGLAALLATGALAALPLSRLVSPAGAARVGQDS
jgi:hypothetical protein